MCEVSSPSVHPYDPVESRTFLSKVQYPNCNATETTACLINEKISQTTCVVPGEKLEFLIWCVLFFRKLWLYAIFVSVWSIVYLISESTNKMVCLSVLGLHKATPWHHV